MPRLSAQGSVLLIVDVQDKLLGAMPDAAALVRDVAFLANAARLLEVPVVATEQYPKGLGPTTAALTPLLGVPAVAKVSFSCLGCEPFKELLAITGRKDVVLVGIEAHVCVLQTALDLIEAGYTVYLPTDACDSRRASDKQVALRRLERAGVILTTAETTVFEWLRGADHQSFKAVSQLVKERPIAAS